MNENMTSNQLKSFMERHGLNREMLAQLLGVTKQAVEHWERDRREIPKTTTRLLRLFDKFPQLLKEY